MKINERFSKILARPLIIALAVVGSLLIGSIFVLIAGGSPLAAYKQLLLIPFSTMSNIGELLTNLTPLLVVGVGVAIARHAGLTNLGGEGQIYMGALGIILVSSSSLPDLIGAWAVIPAVLLAMLLGGLWGAISGVMKAYFQANEIITSLMLNYVAVNIIGFLVRGPIQEPAGVAPESARIAEFMRLSKIIPSSRAHAGIFIALVMVALYYIFIYRTKVGFNIQVLGGNVKAAMYSGINYRKYYLLVMALSGAIVGLAGGIEVLGVYFKLTEKLAGSLGFTGLVVAQLGMLHPIGIVLAAVLMALLTTGSQYMQVSSGIPVSLVGLLQGLIVVFVLYGMSLLSDKKKGKLN